jgi:uncharacterized protein YutE (UPF0331/DUF86 family)
VVNKPKLDNLLTRLDGYLAVLRNLAAIPPESFLADRDKIGNTKYHFVIAIECGIDIANHIIASEGLRFPRDNGDSFSVLVENGILPKELKDPLMAMARFRNRLVHLYWDVEDQKVYEYLQTSLDDLGKLLRTVAAHPW